MKPLKASRGSPMLMLGLLVVLMGYVGSSWSLCIGSYAIPPRLQFGKSSRYAVWSLPRPKITRKVRETRRGGQSSWSRGPGPRLLTSKISKATSAAAILKIVGEEVDNEVFNDFHMSAAFTRLARFSKRRQLRPADVSSQTWLRLAARLRRMLKEDALTARGVSNVFWANGELYAKVAGCDSQLLVELGKCLLDKVRVMNAQDLSNSLWAAATLQEVAVEALTSVPALAAHVPQKVGDMKPQEISNSLWAAAKLQASAPEVLSAVPALAAEIPHKVEGMIPQQLSNILWAAAALQDAAPEVLMAVPAITAAVPRQVGDMVPQALSNCFWAAASLQDAAPEILTAVSAMAACVCETVEDMNAQDLSNNLWAAAKLQDAVPAVLLAAQDLVAQMLQNMGSMHPKGLQMSLWAASELGEEELEHRIELELARRKC